MIYNIYSDAAEYNAHSSLGVLPQINQLRANTVGPTRLIEDSILQKRPNQILEPEIDRILNPHSIKKIKPQIQNLKNKSCFSSGSVSEIEEEFVKEKSTEPEKVIFDGKPKVGIVFDGMLKKTDNLVKNISLNENDFSDEDNDLFVI